MEFVSKTFIEAVNKYPNVKDIKKKYLRDRRITQTEKKILTAMTLVRVNQNDQARKILLQLDGIEDEVVWAHQQLFLGIIENNQGLFSQAIPRLESAKKILVKYSGLRKSLFRAGEYLFIVYSNLHIAQKMNDELNFLERVTNSDRKETACLLKFKLSHYLFTHQLELAKETIDQLEVKKKDLSENELSYYLIEKFNYYLTQGHFENCSRSLAELKKIRKFYLSSNFKFMKGLLAFISQDSPLYLYPQDFKEQPYLLHQVEVLRALETANPAKALVHWLELKILAPNLYRSDFQYYHQSDLFAFALKKLLPKLSGGSHVNINLDLFTTKEEKLLELLKSVKLIRKEEAFFQIWKKELETDVELNKLNKLILRVRDKFKLNLIHRNGVIEYIDEKDKTA